MTLLTTFLSDKTTLCKEAGMRYWKRLGVTPQKTFLA